MKSVLMTAVVSGIVIAGIIHFLMNSQADPKKEMNVEDGFPVG